MDVIWNGGGGCSLPALAFAAISRGLRTQRRQPLRRQKAQYRIGLGSFDPCGNRGGSKDMVCFKVPTV